MAVINSSKPPLETQAVVPALLEWTHSYSSQGHILTIRNFLFLSAGTVAGSGYLLFGNGDHHAVLKILSDVYLAFMVLIGGVISDNTPSHTPPPTWFFSALKLTPRDIMALRQQWPFLSDEDKSEWASYFSDQVIHFISRHDEREPFLRESRAFVRTELPGDSIALPSYENCFAKPTMHPFIARVLAGALAHPHLAPMVYQPSPSRRLFVGSVLGALKLPTIPLKLMRYVPGLSIGPPLITEAAASLLSQIQTDFQKTVLPRSYHYSIAGDEKPGIAAQIGSGNWAAQDWFSWTNVVTPNQPLEVKSLAQGVVMDAQAKVLAVEMLNRPRGRKLMEAWVSRLQAENSDPLHNKIDSETLRQYLWDEAQLFLEQEILNQRVVPGWSRSALASLDAPSHSWETAYDAIYEAFEKQFSRPGTWQFTMMRLESRIALQIIHAPESVRQNEGGHETSAPRITSTSNTMGQLIDLLKHAIHVRGSAALPTLRTFKGALPAGPQRLLLTGA